MLEPASIIFLAVGTPQAEDGAANLSALWAVAEGIARAANAPKIIVIKSTVPVGTNGLVHNLLAKASQLQFDVVSNPEFMKEGAAHRRFHETRPRGNRHSASGTCRSP